MREQFELREEALHLALAGVVGLLGGIVNALFFLAMGFANLYVMYHFSEETWATFKVFGATGLTFLFMLAQLPWLAKYVQEKQ